MVYIEQPRTLLFFVISLGPKSISTRFLRLLLLRSVSARPFESPPLEMKARRASAVAKRAVGSFAAI